MIIKLKGVNGDELREIMDFGAQNIFVTTEPEVEGNGDSRRLPMPSVVVHVLSSRQREEVAPGHRLSDVTLEIVESYWVWPKGQRLPSKKPIPRRVIMRLFDILHRFCGEE